MKDLLRQYIFEILSRQDYEKTYQTASRVHQDQRRRSGEPYFEHPKAVRNIVRKYYPSDRISQLAALLHDTLEDYEKGGVYKSEEEVLNQIDSSIQSASVKQEVISTVQSLTHAKNVPYTEYVLTLSGNQTALRVKLSDMLHNLSSTPSDRQKNKYATALQALLDQYGGPPPGIDPQHMQELMAKAEMSVNELSKKRKRPGAGFVVVRRFEEGWKVLGLRVYGAYDLPKGGVERRDGGNPFITAQRECFEECGVWVRESDLTWGANSIQVGHITVFLAETNQDPHIQKNAKSGIYEHHSADWLGWDILKQKVHSYLSPAVSWAQTIVEKDQ